MLKSPLNTMLIGFGRIGQMHFSLLNELSEFNVKWVLDSQVESPLKGGSLHHPDELDELLEFESVDAVIIAASSDAHVGLIKTVLKYGVPTFCEKPVSFHTEELEALSKAISQQQFKLQVGLNRRFDPDFRALKEALARGEIGKAHLYKITNRDPKRPDLNFVKRSGGLFFDFNTHDFDMVHFLTDKRVKEVCAFGGALIEPELEALNDIDTAAITLSLEDGSLVSIDASRETNAGYDQRIEVHGEKGMLRVDNLTESTLSSLTEKGECSAPIPWNFQKRYKVAYLEQFRAFAAFIKGEIRHSPASITDMLKAVQIAHLATHSLASGQSVKQSVCA